MLSICSGDFLVRLRTLHRDAGLDRGRCHPPRAPDGRNQRTYRLILCSVEKFGETSDLLMGKLQRDKARVIETLLFVNGLNTLLQTLLGTRLPTVMNPSFAFLVPVISTIRDFESQNYDNPQVRNSAGLPNLLMQKRGNISIDVIGVCGVFVAAIMLSVLGGLTLVEPDVLFELSI